MINGGNKTKRLEWETEYLAVYLIETYSPLGIHCTVQIHLKKKTKMYDLALLKKNSIYSFFKHNCIPLFYKLIKLSNMYEGCFLNKGICFKNTRKRIFKNQIYFQILHISLYFSTQLPSLFKCLWYFTITFWKRSS